jgi:hypothetical protein
MRLINSDTRSGLVFRKMPDAITAPSTSRCRAGAAVESGDPTCKAFGICGTSSDVALTRFTAAHHDEVVAMHAVDDASATAAGPIMPPTVEMGTHVD